MEYQTILKHQTELFLTSVKLLTPPSEKINEEDNKGLFCCNSVIVYTLFITVAQEDNL